MMPVNGLVTTGRIAALAANLSRQIGRRVVVHHSRYQFRIPGSVRLKWSPWRYTLLIEGYPHPFADMTVNEVSARMTMLSDLIYAKILQTGAQNDEPSRAHEGGTDVGGVSTRGSNSDPGPY